MDQVNHPSHYNQGKIEVIEFIEDQGLGMHLGNAIKYISRAGKKNPQKTEEDLKKAIWYIQRFLEIQKPENEIRRPNAMNSTSYITSEGLLAEIDEAIKPRLANIQLCDVARVIESNAGRKIVYESTIANG